MEDPLYKRFANMVKRRNGDAQALSKVLHDLVAGPTENVILDHEVGCKLETPAGVAALRLLGVELMGLDVAENSPTLSHLVLERICESEFVMSDPRGVDALEFLLWHFLDIPTAVRERAIAAVGRGSAMATKHGVRALEVLLNHELRVQAKQVNVGRNGTVLDRYGEGGPEGRG
eukprot:GDKH01002431.1.p1 GENE.GDKH01002431.1~~GDKH01002431.1.p1  ORF type:complete len:174 (+),score=36.94 GDKH01002431.1:165-686(+)